MVDQSSAADTEPPATHSALRSQWLFRRLVVPGEKRRRSKFPIEANRNARNHEGFETQFFQAIFSRCSSVVKLIIIKSEKLRCLHPSKKQLLHVGVKKLTKQYICQIEKNTSQILNLLHFDACKSKLATLKPFKKVSKPAMTTSIDKGKAPNT